MRNGMVTGVLTLTLFATPVWAIDFTFYVTNSSPDTITVKCSTDSTESTLAQDEAQGFSCTGTLVIQQAGEEESAEHDIAYDCDGDSIKFTTALRASDSDNLTFIHNCVSREQVEEHGLPGQ